MSITKSFRFILAKKNYPPPFERYLIHIFLDTEGRPRLQYYSSGESEDKGKSGVNLVTVGGVIVIPVSL